MPNEAPHVPAVTVFTNPTADPTERIARALESIAASLELTARPAQVHVHTELDGREVASAVLRHTRLQPPCRS